MLSTEDFLIILAVTVINVVFIVVRLLPSILLGLIEVVAYKGREGNDSN